MKPDTVITNEAVQMSATQMASRQYHMELTYTEAIALAATLCETAQKRPINDAILDKLYRTLGCAVVGAAGVK
jgi:hypothetical protein